MTRPGLPAVPPERMTARARGYLLAAGLQHLVIGMSLLLAPGTFQTPAFRAIFEIAPRPFWTIALITGGLHLLLSALIGSQAHARTALTLSAAVSFMWACAFAYVIGAGVASVFAFAMLVGCGIRDLIACAQPLRSPFERIDMPQERHPPTGR